MGRRHRAAALAASALLAAAGPLAVPSALAAPAPAAPAAPAPTAAPAPARTAVTFEVDGCDGCEMGVTSAVWPEAEGEVPDVWTARPRRVVDGEVTFSVPSDRVRGLAATVTAPWEGNLGYVTEVVMRYRDAEAGERVRARDAVDLRRASGCWAGTDEAQVTLPLVVKRLRVVGQTGPTTGTIAFAKRGVETYGGMRRAYRGVLGLQDVQICGPER